MRRKSAKISGLAAHFTYDWPSSNIYSYKSSFWGWSSRECGTISPWRTTSLLHRATPASWAWSSWRRSDRMVGSLTTTGSPWEAAASLMSAWRSPLFCWSPGLATGAFDSRRGLETWQYAAICARVSGWTWSVPSLRGTPP